MRGRFVEACAFADRAGAWFIVLEAFVAALLVEFGFDGGFEFRPTSSEVEILDPEDKRSFRSPGGFIGE